MAKFSKQIVFNRIGNIAWYCGLAFFELSNSFYCFNYIFIDRYNRIIGSIGSAFKENYIKYKNVKGFEMIEYIVAISFLATIGVFTYIAFKALNISL